MAISNRHIPSLINVNAALKTAVQDHYKSMGLQYMDVPEIVGITGACENVDTLFKVGNRQNLPLFFTQTGQLALEQALAFFPGVYTVIHSGRDEETEDDRHLRQFRLIEEEFDCTVAGMDSKNYDEDKMFDALLQHIQQAIQAIVKSVSTECKKDLQNIYKQDVGWLKEVSKRPFYRIPYEEAVVLLKWNGFSYLKFGDDLKADHEQKIVELVNKKLQNGKTTREFPVFITHYPEEIKFFNMKVSKNDPRVVLSADLILPRAGESVGSAVREHDGKRLKGRLLSSFMFKIHKERGGKYEDFTWYVDGLVGAGKTRPHAGYGIGNERVIQFILGQKDIRDCSLFSILSRKTGDWDKKKSGKMYLFSADKKMVLLSIGKEANKKQLLSSIKKVYKNGNNLVFYSTDNTYKFLDKNKIDSTLVHKISDKNSKPNINDLINENFFDVIVNIPTRGSNPNSEVTDGRKIRAAAVKTGTHLITDVEVAQEFLNGFSKYNKNGIRA